MEDTKSRRCCDRQKHLVAMRTYHNLYIIEYLGFWNLNGIPNNVLEADISHLFWNKENWPLKC